MDDPGEFDATIVAVPAGSVFSRRAVGAIVIAAVAPLVITMFVVMFLVLESVRSTEDEVPALQEEIQQLQEQVAELDGTEGTADQPDAIAPNWYLT